MLRPLSRLLTRRPALRPAARAARLVSLSVLALALLASSAAWAWSSFTAVDVRDHGFSFRGVELDSPNEGPQRCLLGVTVTYKAPSAKRATFFLTVKTREGRTVTSRLDSQRAGTQRYHFTFDTSTEGCWARGMTRPASLAVRYCAGGKC